MSTNIHAIVNSNKASKIIDAGYHQQKCPDEVLKELHTRGYEHVTIEHIEKQWDQWDKSSTDEPNW